MVKIRLARGGSKKRPFYPIVATDSRNARDAKPLESLGFFNPVARGSEERLRLDLVRVEYWIANGAQVTDRVKALIADAKLGAEAVAEKRVIKTDKLQAKKQEKLAEKAAAEKAEAEKVENATDTADEASA
ncbi:MAG: 30S ribosomal protein S16 [Gammaproteobacteria bacterium]|nr:30S ribosomal protein S16 [Gammaproteobacteria bacterium]